MDSKFIVITAIALQFFSIATYANDQRLSDINSSGVEVSHPLETITSISQLVYPAKSQNVYKVKNNKVFKFIYNNNKQLVSAKRIGGKEIQYAYSSKSTKQPYAIKFGNRSWQYLITNQLIKNDSIGLPVDNPNNEIHSVDTDHFPLRTFDANSLQFKTIVDEDEEDEEDAADINDYIFIMFGDGGYGGGGSGGGGSGGGSGGYCQTSQCSFTSLAECLQDCSNTRYIGLATCVAAAFIPLIGGGLSAACGLAVEIGYNETCVPGCQGGRR